MKKILILLIAFCYSCFVYAQEQTWRTIPYFLKGYEAQYEKSPKEAALAWFKDARFGLFVHWGPASLYGKGEWVMYNEQIPVKEYEQKAREFIFPRLLFFKWLYMSRNLYILIYLCPHCILNAMT